ncbi:hypothetical protein Vadar_017911 [Vaccinium darrowii]|uniref:Uncharacterized protein n=1 Tax=Vaccinium darrowii TaxID=229202 RepID=A0ACB7ZCI7_9ERIC|nr:hypothetical protein Vadar_017911 [Vaccinium darrowii]
MFQDSIKAFGPAGILSRCSYATPRSPSLIAAGRVRKKPPQPVPVNNSVPTEKCSRNCELRNCGGLGSIPVPKKQTHKKDAQFRLAVMSSKVGVVLFPVAVTFFVTWWFIQFVDGFFSPLYEQLGIDIFEKLSKSTERVRRGRAYLDHPQVINVQNKSKFVGAGLPLFTATTKDDMQIMTIIIHWSN